MIALGTRSLRKHDGPYQKLNEAACHVPRLLRVLSPLVLNNVVLPLKLAAANITRVLLSCARSTGNIPFGPAPVVVLDVTRHVSLLCPPVAASRVEWAKNRSIVQLHVFSDVGGDIELLSRRIAAFDVAVVLVVRVKQIAEVLWHSLRLEAALPGWLRCSRRLGAAAEARLALDVGRR